MATMIGTSPECAGRHGGLFVHDPVRLVLRTLHISAWRVCAERPAGLSHCFENGLYFTAAFPGVKLISQPRIKNDGLYFDISDEIVFASLCVLDSPLRLCKPVIKAAMPPFASSHWQAEIMCFITPSCRCGG